MDVFLDYAGSAPISSWIFNDLFDFVEFFCNLDSLTLISVFTWLDNPDILLWLLRLVILRLLVLFSLFLIRTALRRRHIIFITLLLPLPHFSLLFLFLLLLSFLHPYSIFMLVVILFEPMKVGIVEPVLDMEGHWQIIPNALIHGLIVVLHIEVQRLLVI